MRRRPILLKRDRPARDDGLRVRVDGLWPRGGRLTLLFGARDLRYNHAVVLRDVLEGTSRLPTRQDCAVLIHLLLEAKIDELPDACRSVLVLRALEDFSVQQSAEALGIRETTVRTRFFRARKALSPEIDLACVAAGAMSPSIEGGNKCRRS